MVLEIAQLQVRQGETGAFEEAFHSAAPIIKASPGYIGRQLRRCLESDHRYALLVRWQTLEGHTVGFRGSQRYQEWRGLLHHFYDPMPQVEHLV